MGILGDIVDFRIGGVGVDVVSGLRDLNEFEGVGLDLRTR